jgi:beta-barrel assembly-enhancing protease
MTARRRRPWAVPALFLALAGPAAAFDLRILNDVTRSIGGGSSSDTMRHLETGAQVVGSLRKGVQDLTPEEEYYIGRSVAARIFADYPPANNPKANEYINLVGNYLAQQSPRPETFGGYHFQLVQSDETNAFAAPGGFVLVTTGLYRRLESEEQLAAVLAHEISHITLDHGLSAIKTSNLTQAFTLIGKTALMEKSEKARMLNQLTDTFDASIDDIINQLVVKGYSRGQEMDADRAAVDLLYQAGYAPQGLAEFLRTLADRPQKGGFYSTHPPAAERRSAVESQLRSRNLTVAAEPARDKRFQGYKLK